MGLRIAVVILLGFLITSAAFAQKQDLKSVSGALVAEGERQQNADNLAEAQRYFERALVANPANVTALLNLGQVHEAQGRVGRSLKYYRQALELDPRNVDGLQFQAIAFLKRTLVDRAEQNVDRLVEICGEGCTAVADVRTAITSYRQNLADATPAEPGR